MIPAIFTIHILVQERIKNAGIESIILQHPIHILQEMPVAVNLNLNLSWIIIQAVFADGLK